MALLLEAMRNDLGLETTIEDADIAHAIDEEAQPEILAEGETTPYAPEGN